jgi:hypothetical protein
MGRYMDVKIPCELNVVNENMYIINIHKPTGAKLQLDLVLRRSLFLRDRYIVRLRAVSIFLPTYT